MVSEVVSFTIDSMIKGYHVYKYVWQLQSFKCCTTAVMKKAEKGLFDRHPAATELEETQHSLQVPSGIVE